MFQSFDETADFSRSAERVERLRAGFAEAGIDAFIIPRSDEHQGEYIPDSAARLAWLTGFTGSAGVAVVFAGKAAILTDGRYTLQVRSQVDLSVFATVNSVETPLAAYLEREAAGLRIGFDPWLHTIGDLRRLRKTVEATGGQLVTLPANPVDRIWNERPAPPKGRVGRHAETFAGRPSAEKIRDLQAGMEGAKVQATVLTDPSSIAWTFNIRGSDVAHTPLPLAFAILPASGRPALFIDPDKPDGQCAEYLRGLCDLRHPDEFEAAVGAWAEAGPIGLDPALAAARLMDLVEAAGGSVVDLSDPAKLPRAAKNEAEIAGSRAAHLRDGTAVCAFLRWLDQQAPGTVTEIPAATELERLRAAFGKADGMPLRDISFDTIAGSGPNGAIVHYRVNRQTDRTLEEGELFLLDSGAQYEDGTTDITRTIPIGEPGEEMRRKFTLVLKGMIAISTARFPHGTRGVDLDPLARIALWKAGSDYAHGTGHGVGSYLAVHEGPQSISKRGMATLETGMILSNEPGYYREGQFGIRIENLILVTPPAQIEGGDIAMHAFETLTLAPIDRRLIMSEMLGEDEIAWIDAYHARVREELSPKLEQSSVEWLNAATRPLNEA